MELQFYLSSVKNANLDRPRLETRAIGTTAVQVALSYSDGLGREIQKKMYAGVGKAFNALGVEVNNVNRWLTSGWQIFNNKGKVVRQYEPYFSDSYIYIPNFIVGVSPILCYDPLGRAVATLHPDKSWEKVDFTPWTQRSWDRNDTSGIDTLQRLQQLQ